MVVRFLMITLVACSLAGAASITATGIDPNRAMEIDFNEDGVLKAAQLAGVINITLVDDTGTYYRDTLCVDLFRDVFLGTQYTTHVYYPNQVTWRDIPRLERVAWLIDNALVFTPYTEYANTPQLGAGLQLAIWDITVDGGDGFGAGDGRVTAAASTDSAVLAAAVQYEADSQGHLASLAFVYDNCCLDDGGPAQMLEGPRFEDEGPHPTPEPRSFLLLGGALVATACFTRKKKTS